MKTTKKQREHFRVAIFGSARIKKDDKNYKLIFRLAKLLGQRDIDIVTGGGPGTMEAANAGHQQGDKTNVSQSYGLLIRLPREQRANAHLDVKKEFQKFSERLHTFMDLSNVVVVAPGGIGTILEFYYALQLVQTRKVKEVPIIMIGEQWPKLIDWMKKEVMKRRYISSEELDSLFHVKSVENAFKLIMKTKELIDKKQKNIFPQLKAFCKKEVK